MRTVWKAADILLPAEGVDMALWPALACDQFTSQPEYWQRAEALCMDVPSTLHITLPEVYLEQRGVAAHISTIHAAMREYALGVLTRRMHGFVYTERRFPGKAQVRCGLVGAVDLEAYSYEKGARALVRPSENTVVERIPPRLAVRRGALLESPHILMLLDDEARSVIEPFAAQKAALTQLYDTDLMLNGGRVAGWAVTDEAAIKSVENAVARFGTQEVFDAKYPAAKGAAPLALAMPVAPGQRGFYGEPARWDEEFDVIVIGSGFAGLAAAGEAASRGAKVVVLEKMPIAGGNSVINGGGYNAWTDNRKMREKLGLGEDSAELHLKDSLKGGDFFNIPELTKTVIDGS
ncbi:MAG: FAD-dependent oxidoreductase, partial [Ruthenibacterium sp.]